MNGNRYTLLIPSDEANHESTQKLDTELLESFSQLIKDYLDTVDVIPGFDKVGHNLRMALKCSKGENIDTDSVINFQFDMLQLYPEDMDKFIDYRYSNKLIEGLFQQLDKKYIGYNVCSKVLEGAIPKSDHPTLIKHVCTYIGHPDGQVNRLAQDCVLHVLQKEENCEECLFIFIEFIR